MLSETKQKNKKEKPILRTFTFMLKKAWKQRPVIFLIYFIQLILQAGSSLAEMILPKLLIDRLIIVIEQGNSTQIMTEIIIIAGSLVGIPFITSALGSVMSGWESSITEWFDERLKEDISRHAMEMDYQHTEDPDALDQLNKAREGISWYSGGVCGILSQFKNIVINAAIFIGAVVIIATGCPWLLLIQMASLLLMSLFVKRINKLNLQFFKELAKVNRTFSYYFYQLADFKFGKDMRLYDSADMINERTLAHNKENTRLFAETNMKCFKNQACMDVINGVRDAASFFYIGVLALTKAITIGDFSMYMSAASSGYWSLQNAVMAVQEIIKKCGYAYEYLKFLDYPAAMEYGTKKASPADYHNGITIEFSHVSFKYPRTDRWILKDVSITIRPGEHLSVVGLNGAGKTTFIKLLCRLYDVNEGEILVGGVNIKEYSAEEYRKLLAVVFQDFQLFAFSLRENIAFGENGKDTDEKINKVLELSGLMEDAEKLPEGLDTMLYKSFDEKGTELSGGQKQKLAISRALYKNAPVVILDEPTAALDPVAEYEIYRQFNELVGGKTAVYISHRLSSCKFCDKIAVFENEKIAEYGTHDELLTLNGTYAKMFKAQAKYYA